MADDKKQQRQRKLQGNFDTEEAYALALEKSYEELEKKLGMQGDELGKLRKDSGDAQKSLQTYADQVKQYKQYADWYTQNYNQILEWAKQSQQPRLQPAQQATSLLTAEEQQALIQQSLQAMQQHVLAPWAQNFATEADKYLSKKLTEQQEAAAKREKALLSVTWKALEKLSPKEKVEELNAYFKEAAEVADPTKFDPMQVANERFESRAKLLEYESKIKELEREREEAAKKAVPSFGNRSLFPAQSDDTEKKTPQSRDERYAAVMKDVQDKSGADGVAALFGR